MTFRGYAHDTLTKIGANTRKPTPVSDAFDMQFRTDFFSYQFLVSNK